jgi:hypothetical protein
MKTKRVHSPSGKSHSRSERPVSKMQTLLRAILLAATVIALLLWITDRPFGGSGYEAEDIKTNEEAARLDESPGVIIMMIVSPLVLARAVALGTPT